METPSAKHILIAPLDWGLGHTTRCIPLIRHLLQQGHKVTAAGNEVQQKLLQDACPDITMTYLGGYNVGYSKNEIGFMWSMLTQLPRLRRVIRQEHQWLKDFVVSEKIDGVISDNRYGLYHNEISSVIMTHQLEVQTGLGGFFDRLLRPLHYRFLEHFSAVWVVDSKPEPSLAGLLSHPEKLPPRSQYLGWLSQMDIVPENESDSLLILLSGPEPQRSILSELLWKQAKKFQRKIIFVEGAPQMRNAPEVPAHIQYYGRLTNLELQPIIAQAGMVICRSGYSTLMDLVSLRKKAILIPTPGQTEQLYLAKTLQEKGHFLSVKQSDFILEKVVEEARSFPFKIFDATETNNAFKPVLDAWLVTL